MKKHSSITDFNIRHYQFLLWTLTIMITTIICCIIKFDGLEYIALIIIMIYLIGDKIIDNYGGIKK